MDQILIYYAWIDSDRFYQSSPTQEHSEKHNFHLNGPQKGQSTCAGINSLCEPPYFFCIHGKKTNKQTKQNNVKQALRMNQQ